MRKIKSKRGQQEIVGFVVIILIVVIVGVIFLGIMLRKQKLESIEPDDVKISSFLSASADYTTDCVVSSNYADIKRLLKECYRNPTQTCLEQDSAGFELSARKICNVLDQTYAEMLESLWKVGEDRPDKYLKLTLLNQAILDSGDYGSKEVIKEIEQGDESLCKNRKAGQTLIYSSGDALIIELEVCN